MRGKPYGAFDLDQVAISASLAARRLLYRGWHFWLISLTANSLAMSPKETATHLSLSALINIGRQGASEDVLTAEVRRMIGQDAELPEDELQAAIGEM
jgi:hypothetical protein